MNSYRAGIADPAPGAAGKDNSVPTALGTDLATDLDRVATSSCRCRIDCGTLGG